MKCFDCSRPATSALDLGQLWADDRPRYLYACRSCAQETVTYQATQDRTVTEMPIGESNQLGYCAACWGSHCCDLPDDHPEGSDHVCGSLDPEGKCGTPFDQMEVFHRVTFRPCARTGGVKAS